MIVQAAKTNGTAAARTRARRRRSSTTSATGSANASPRLSPRRKTPSRSCWIAGWPVTRAGGPRWARRVFPKLLRPPFGVLEVERSWRCRRTARRPRTNLPGVAGRDGLRRLLQPGAPARACPAFASLATRNTTVNVPSGRSPNECRPGSSGRARSRFPARRTSSRAAARAGSTTRRRARGLTSQATRTAMRKRRTMRVQRSSTGKPTPLRSPSLGHRGIRRSAPYSLVGSLWPKTPKSLA